MNGYFLSAKFKAVALQSGKTIIVNCQHQVRSCCPAFGVVPEDWKKLCTQEQQELMDALQSPWRVPVIPWLEDSLDDDIHIALQIRDKPYPRSLEELDHLDS